MIVKIHDRKLHEVIKSIALQIGDGQYSYICDETSIEIPIHMGKGYIKGINFPSGLGILQMDFIVNEPLTFHYQLSKSHPLRIINCQSGSLNYMFEPEYKQHNIHTFQTSLAASTDKYDQLYTFEADTHIRLTSLEIIREKYLPIIECELYTIPAKLEAVFRDINAEDPFLYETSYSLNLGKAVTEIHENTLNGLSRKAFLEAKALEVFGLMIQMYTEDYKTGQTSTLIRTADIGLIHEAERILTEELRTAPTIPELAKAVGINTTKLKQGFKIVFGTTINKYLREKKLDYAAALISSDSLNIRQIADMVGYANPAHFAQLFKERFGALPSEYLKNIKRPLN